MAIPLDAPASPNPREADGESRRDVLRKLAIGGAIAWSAPLIASTAHAAGPTSCEGAEIDFNDYAVGDTFTSATVNGITMTLGASSFFGGSAARATNRTIIGSPIGGIDSKGLRLEQDAVNGGGQEISLTFSQAVYNVTFVITDIDNSEGTTGWSDRIVIVEPTVYSYSFPTGSTVIGAGTATGSTPTTGPFRNSENFNYLNPSPGGNVTVVFPGPLTTFTMRFQCADRQGRNQLINLSNISFCG
jgi:hypothetical protein